MQVPSSSTPPEPDPPNHTTQSVVDPDYVPATTITNPVCGIRPGLTGQSALQYYEFMKTEQNRNLVEGIPPTGVYWDEKNPARFMALLEGCGQSPTVLEERLAGAKAGALKGFDPKAPHFDVIIIDMMQSGYGITRSVGSNVTDGGVVMSPEDYANEINAEHGAGNVVAGVSVRPSQVFGRSGRGTLDALPLESIAGRPGWLFLHVGSTTAGLCEGRRLMKKWGFKRIEAIAWLRASGRWVEGHGNDIFRKGMEWCLVGMKGSVKR